MRRLSIALKRRESVAVLPEVFADFLLRRQGVHAATCGGPRQGGTAVVIEQLQGFAAPASLWESELFPARVSSYRPGWLDELLASGNWLWQAESEGSGEPRVAFLPRTLTIERAVDGSANPLSEPAERTLSLLSQRGASFTVDLVRGTGLEPSRIRAALEELVRRGDVTNDRFDPLRVGLEGDGRGPGGFWSDRPPRGLSRSRPAARRTASTRPQGRWTRLATDPAAGDRDQVWLAWSAALLDRYGVLARETAAMDSWAPPWRELAPCLARAGCGEVRRLLRRGTFGCPVCDLRSWLRHWRNGPASKPGPSSRF